MGDVNTESGDFTYRKPEIGTTPALSLECVHTSAAVIQLRASGNTAHHSLDCDFDLLIEANRNAVWVLGLPHLMARPLNKN